MGVGGLVRLSSQVLGSLENAPPPSDAHQEFYPHDLVLSWQPLRFYYYLQCTDEDTRTQRG